jgi:hypothetical protein
MAEARRAAGAELDKLDRVALADAGELLDRRDADAGDDATPPEPRFGKLKKSNFNLRAQNFARSAPSSTRLARSSPFFSLARLGSARRRSPHPSRVRRSTSSSAIEGAAMGSRRSTGWHPHPPSHTHPPSPTTGCTPPARYGAGPPCSIPGPPPIAESPAPRRAPSALGSPPCGAGPPHRAGRASTPAATPTRQAGATHTPGTRRPSRDVGPTFTDRPLGRPALGIGPLVRRLLARLWPRLGISPLGICHVSPPSLSSRCERHSLACSRRDPSPSATHPHEQTTTSSRSTMWRAGAG